MKPIKSLLTKFSRKPAAAVDIGGFDPFDPDFIADPFPMLAALRQTAPVHRLANGSWVLSSYQDIAQALTDPRLVNSPSRFAVVNPRNAQRYTCANVAQNILPFQDAPEHTEPRKALARHFYDAFRKEQNNAQKITSTLWRNLSGEVDLLSDFATPLCSGMMGRLLGLGDIWQDPKAVAQLKQWAEWFFYLFSILPDEQTRAQLDRELDAAREFLTEFVQPGKSHLVDCLMSETEGLAPLRADALRDNALLLLADGVNADHGIANALLMLMQHPEALQDLRSNPERIPQASEELLRLSTPSLFIARRAAEDLEINGQAIRKDSGVLLMLASANRDEAVFENGDMLNIDRPRRQQLTFGRGEHACLGRHLVNEMMHQALGALVSSDRSAQLTKQPPQWSLRAGHRWLASLPVTLGPVLTN